MIKNRGFTLVELVMTMVIIGIMAVFVAPRFFDADIFKSRGFADQVQASLRYAQKVAIAQNRFVCVAFTSTSVTLTIDSTVAGLAHPTATCPGNDLTSPTGETPYTITAPGNVNLSGGSAFSFDAVGRPSAAQTINVTGATNAITIEAWTGYVH